MIDQNDFNRKVIEEFRENRSKGLVEKRPRLLLTTIGARTGQLRTRPMMYILVGDSLLVIASNAGAPSHPDWYYNLVAHYEVTVEFRDEIFEAIAVVAEGAEREQLWNKVVEQYSFFAEHQTKTARQIPVIVLRRRPA